MFKFQIAATPRSLEVRSQSHRTEQKPQQVGKELTTLQQRAVSGGAPVNKWK